MALTFDFGPNDPGSIFVEDDDVPGNATGQVRHSAGDFPTTAFAYPADDLFLYYAAGQRAYFDLFDSLAFANLTVGNLSNPTTSPDAIHVRRVETGGSVILASRGAIAEWGNDADPDIITGVLGALALSAASGIGTASNALETQATWLTAETVTGGINIVSLGTVGIGSGSGDIGGLSVGSSGNISLEAYGQIVLLDTDGLEIIKGGSTSGNVVLNAIGLNSDIGGASDNTADNHAITASAGSIALTAGRNVSFGFEFGAGLDSDLRADGNITINAGALVWLEGFAEVISDDFGHDTGGDVTITAGDVIHVETSAAVGAAGTGGGNVTLTAAVLELLAPSSQAIFSQSGDVTVNAGNVSIQGDSGITANDGSITIRPQTAGRAMVLGTPPAPVSALSLRLSEAELHRLFTPNLVLGGSTAGRVTVVSSISTGGPQDLTIQSGSDITVNAGVNVFVLGDLTLRAGDDVALAAGSSLIVDGGTFTGYVDVGNADPGKGGRAWVDVAFTWAVRFFGGNDGDTLLGGANNDRLDGAGGADTMRGRGGNDTYFVDNAGDVTSEGAGEGIDTVRTSMTWTLADNVDILTQLGVGNINGTGNTIANTLNGNTGANTLSGLGGNDTLLGNVGNDTLLGGDANDLLNGGAGNDVMNGGSGVDTVSYAGAVGAITVALIGGAQATGGSGNDTLSNIENLTGSGHNDQLTGDAAVNILTGGNGNDVLNGLGGNDTLFGDSGADRLVGGTGRDVMTGGSNADIFDFNAVNETGITSSTRDQIVDFVQGSDKIDLATIDANTVASGNQAFAFIGAAAFGGLAGQLRAVSNATQTIIYGDVNGDRTADFQIQLNTALTLAAGDFVL